MNTPPEKTAPQGRRGFFTRKRLIILLVLSLVTGLVLLIAIQNDDAGQSSSTSVWEKLRHPVEWAERIYGNYQWKRDLAALRKEIKEKTSELGPEHSEVLQARQQYALYLFLGGQQTEAETEYRSILPMCERVFGPEDGLVSQARRLLAEIYMKNRKYDQAEALYRAQLKAWGRVDGKETEEMLLCVYYLVYCLKEQGKREEAIPYAQRAVEGYRQIVGTNDFRLTNAEELLEDLQRK